MEMRRVERAESEAAAVRIASHAVRTPLVKLNWTRPDAPQLEIYLKLESLQPISSFKVRGAVNTILSRIERAAAAGNPIDASKMHVVTASAGNTDTCSVITTTTASPTRAYRRSPWAGNPSGFHGYRAQIAPDPVARIGSDCS